ncbi:hypothetical protein SLA2020_350220 [Shorea laevis]
MSTTRRFQRPKKSTVKFYSRVRGSRYNVDSDSMVYWIRKVDGDVAVQDKINDSDRHSFVYCFLCWRVRQVTHYHGQFFDLASPKHLFLGPTADDHDQGVLGTIHLSPCSPSHLYEYY